MAVLLVTATITALPAVAAKPPSGGGGGGSGLSITDYAQCQNDAPPSTRLDCSQWGNGILNTSNSHYAEDEVTPQRLLLTGVPSGTHTVALRYLTRKGTIHAYDSLATWNVTQTQADRCQGLKGCPGGTASVLDMGIDAASAPHALPQTSRQWVLYGGSLQSTTTPVIGADDYASVSVTFNATSSTVQLLWGGHLAASTGPRGWGAGQGSSNINGGPYHIKLDTVDGASAGDKDNQIMSSAILAGSPSFSITKTVNGQSTITAEPGATVTYVITVTNNGTASGSTMFTDDFDDQLNPTTPVSNPSGGSCTREPAGSTNKLFNCSTSLLAAGGGQQSFTYMAALPTTFSTTSSTDGCSTSGQFAVRNTATLATGGSSTSIVCVNTSPNITWIKQALNPTTGAEVTTVNPGTTVLYRITATNYGSGPGSTAFTDNFDDRLNPSGVTVSHPPTGGACTREPAGSTDKLFNCTTGILDPGQSQTFSYTAAMPTSFDDTSDTTGCQPGQFAVKNTVTVNGTIVATRTVCVNAAPGITFTKVALKPDGTPLGTVSPGDTVLYRITATNGGTAPGTATYVDDFDDRLNPSSVTVSHPPTGGACTREAAGSTNKLFNCTTGVLNPTKSQTFSYTATMPTSFPSGSPTDGCQPGQFAVRNDVKVNGVIVATKTVCVTAAPIFSSTKQALKPDGTPLGTVNPGDTVLYKITITNSGAAAGSTTYDDNYDDRITDISAVTSTPTGGTCAPATMSDGTAGWHCTTGTIAPNGGTQVFTYTAKMPTTFTGSPGGFNCSVRNPHQYPVHNDVLLANGTTSNATVCVNAAPDLHLVKSVTSDTDSSGNVHLTYTLTYSNTGPAEATTAGIIENVPTGTTYESCTGGCNSSNLPQVSWTVGPIAPLTGTGFVTLTVLLTTTTSCQITNTATIQFDTDAPVSSNTVVINVDHFPNPAGAHANGSATGAQVLSSGLLNINTAPISSASSTQTGPGGTNDSDEILSIQIPSGGSVLDASVLRTTSASTVSAAPAEARQTSTAETAHVCAVKALTGLCAVEADAVRAVASTTAAGDSSSYSSAGSTITNLKVAGVVTPVDLNQTTTIPLSAALFGAGSYVAINERTGTTGSPAAGQSSGGTYSADLTVTMIHVKVTGLLGLQAAEVIVSRATAHSDFPQTTVCPGAVGHSVSGHAYVAGLWVPGAASPPLLANLLQGYVAIPSTGGSESQHIALLRVPADGSVVSAQAADSSSTGSLGPNPHSASFAEVAGDGTTPICVLRTGTTCIATATLIHSESHSNAVAGNPGATSNDSGTQFVGLTVLGIPIAGTPAPNTTIPIPGLGFIVLNEQTCDGGGTANHTCSGDDHSGLTVRAIHVYVTVANLLGLDLGVELIVAEAHSDATYIG